MSLRWLAASTLLVGSRVLSQGPPADELSRYRLARVIELQGATHHVQGVDFDGHDLWLTSVDRATLRGFLYKFSMATGELERAVEVQDGNRFHPGGISADGDSVWIPVAEYRRASSAVIQRRNKLTLELEFEFKVSDHVGCVAATPTALIGANWDSEDFFFWDRRGRLIRKVPNITGVAYQDMKYDGGHIVASGNLPDRSGAIDWLEYPSLRLTRRIRAGNNDRGVLYTREAMAIHGSRLMLVPEDGQSRAFIFDLSEMRSPKKPR